MECEGQKWLADHSSAQLSQMTNVSQESGLAEPLKLLLQRGKNKAEGASKYSHHSKHQNCSFIQKSPKAVLSVNISTTDCMA